MQPLHKKSFAAEQLRRQKRVSPVQWILFGIFIIALIVGGYVFYQKSIEKKQVETEIRQIKSIAVLPFRDMSPDKDQDHLCEGIADALIDALANVENLQVPASTSSFLAREKGYDIPEIGEKLNVQTVLEGSLQKSGDRLRIRVQLINVNDGFHIWSDTIEYSIDDIFSLEDEISQKIVEKLHITVKESERTAIGKRPTDNSEAYQLYLKGRHFLNKRTKASITSSLDYFQEALRKDPKIALAYAGIADSYNLLGIWGYMPPRDVFPKAKEAAQKALEIDETVAEAYTSLGFVNLYFDWDWKTAEKRFKQAITLKPSYVLAHKWYAEIFHCTGRYDNAIREFRKALDYDPLYLQTYSNFADMYVSMGSYEEALNECQKALEIDQHFAPTYSMMGWTFLAMNTYQEAIQHFTRALELSNEFVTAKAGLGYTYAKAGDRKKAEQILTSLIEQKHREYIPSYRIAFIYLGLGEHDTALEWLEKAYEEREHGVLFLSGSEFDPIRSDPRFKTLLTKMNLPEY